MIVPPACLQICRSLGGEHKLRLKIVVLTPNFGESIFESKSQVFASTLVKFAKMSHILN